jgi:hypothetical protein
MASSGLNRLSPWCSIPFLICPGALLLSSSSALPDFSELPLSVTLLCAPGTSHPVLTPSIHLSLSVTSSTLSAPLFPPTPLNTLHQPPFLQPSTSTLPPACLRERGKSRRGARYYNTLSRANRLTPSQRALIAHFASPRHSSQRTQEALQSTPLQFHSVNSVKVEASSSRAHFPLSIPPPLPGLNLVKEEVPPSGTCPPLATNLLAPPIVKPGDPYYGDGSCKVEEEIPPSWQLEDNAVAANKIIAEVVGQEEEEEQPQHFANRLVEEHLLLLFEIRQRQDDQMHSQSILGQRMDILFDALTDAPAHQMPYMRTTVHPGLHNSWTTQLS